MTTTMYPSKWKGGTDPDDKSGVATFNIEGVEYALRLDSFTVFQMVGEMLVCAFNQGKISAAQAMRSNIERAMDQAVIDHARLAPLQDYEIHPPQTLYSCRANG